MSELTEIKTECEQYFEDAAGNVQGVYLSWHSNGRPRLHCIMSDGKKIGEHKVWDKNGDLKSHAFFGSNGELLHIDDISALVADIGNITDGEKLVIKLKMGSRVPELIEVNDEYAHYYIDATGVMHGEFKVWHKNGQIRRHYFFINGLEDGEYKSWHNDGLMWKHCFYSCGHRHGEHKVWHNDGLMWKHCFYLVGKDITAEVSALVGDISALTSEERVLIKLKFGIDCLPGLVNE